MDVGNQLKKRVVWSLGGFDVPAAFPHAGISFGDPFPISLLQTFPGLRGGRCTDSEEAPPNCRVRGCSAAA